MMLLSVAIASKWDEPEKIKVFIVATVRRKVLCLRKEKGTTAQNQRNVVQYTVFLTSVSQEDKYRDKTNKTIGRRLLKKFFLMSKIWVFFKFFAPS